MNLIVSEKDDQEDNMSPGQDTPAPGPVHPAERFLQKDSDDLWKLGPIPGLGTVRNSEVGIALHNYVTQQWSMPIPISVFL